MKTYSEIKAEIAKLEKQAEAVRQSEVAGVVAKIKAAIAAYGITAADLGLGRGAAKAVSPAKKTSKKAKASIGIPKYRDPKTGKTWTGRGKPPTWIAGVKSRDAYLIGSQAVEAGATTRGAAKGGRKAKVPAKVTTPAVEIESGAASE